MDKFKNFMQGVGSLFNIGGSLSYDPELQRILNKTPEQRVYDAWARTGDALRGAMQYEQERQEKAERDCKIKPGKY